MPWQGAPVGYFHKCAATGQAMTYYGYNGYNTIKTCLHSQSQSWQKSRQLENDKPQSTPQLDGCQSQCPNVPILGHAPVACLIRWYDCWPTDRTPSEDSGSGKAAKCWREPAASVAVDELGCPNYLMNCSPIMRLGDLEVYCGRMKSQNGCVRRATKSERIS